MLIASTKHQQRLIDAAESAEVHLHTLEQRLNTLANFAMMSAPHTQGAVDLKVWAEILLGLGENARRLKEQQRQVTAMLHTPLKDQAAYPHQAGYDVYDSHAPVTE